MLTLGQTSRHLAAAAAVLLSVSGCSPSPATSEGMTPNVAISGHQHAGAVRVRVTGGCDDCDLMMAKISNAAFASALRDTIIANHTFARIADGADADYDLAVAIFRVQSPVMGFNMRTQFEAGWTLTGQKDGKVIWREAIDTDHTAMAGEAFAAVTRVRLAWEGAVRKNIVDGVRKLAALRLPDDKQ